MKEPTRKDAGRPGDVAQRVRAARDSLPGERDALPPGTLPGHTSEPQGDEVS
ncbi:MAG: hypothetical protein ABSC95_05370 [Acetobacteraceae bacterium]|jgi:hypothetical protein